MKKIQKKELFSHITNILTIALVIESFLCCMMLVRKMAREDCFARIEETNVQAVQMFNHSMESHMDRLVLFADILAANATNPDAQLQIYMENFCATNSFSSVCIHRANGTIVSYGDHPHDQIVVPGFAQEIRRLPYFSPVYSFGDRPEEKCFYYAVPVVRSGETAGILYGYLFLDKLADFVSTTAYDGNCRVYVVDGENGDILTDAYHGSLGNLFDGSLPEQEVRDGYSMPEMQNAVRTGKSGYMIDRTPGKDEWNYTHYMPIGINNWSMHLVIGESTAFASYNAMSHAVAILAVIVVTLMFCHVAVLMAQSVRAKNLDKERLLKTQYINQVQSALLNAHYDPTLLERALKIVAEKLQAETVLLMTVADRTVTQTYYWPSIDQPQALNLLNRNLRDDFPMIYDQVVDGSSVLFSTAGDSADLSESAQQIFAALDVRNAMVTPIVDTSGSMRGIISAVNLAELQKDAGLLECITYDLFMALTNVENHAIIKHMGTTDYLTNTKNRNCYEDDRVSFSRLPGKSLWCVFIDVNGLHEVNNTRGHKAGDLMLCAVANAVKKNFGSKHSYRLGGDEFVAFVVDGSHEDLMRRKYAITEELEAKGYYVSVGFSGISRSAEGEFDVDRIVAEAETIMYRDKREYYQKNGVPSERGHFPSDDKN